MKRPWLKAGNSLFLHAATYSSASLKTNHKAANQLMQNSGLFITCQSGIVTPCYHMHPHAFFAAQPFAPSTSCKISYTLTAVSTVVRNLPVVDSRDLDHLSEKQQQQQHSHRFHKQIIYPMNTYSGLESHTLVTCMRKFSRTLPWLLLTVNCSYHRQRADKLADVCRGIAMFLDPLSENEFSYLAPIVFL